MPDEGDIRLHEDGSLQAYINGEWLTLGAGTQLVPPEGLPPQYDLEPPPSQTITISDNSGPPNPDPSIPPFAIQWPDIQLVPSGLDSDLGFQLQFPPQNGDIVYQPGPHNSHPLPTGIPDGSVVIREGVGLLVYKEGEWHEVALVPAKIAALQNKVINNLTELVLDLSKRLEKVESIVDVSSRFRKILDDDEQTEVERPPYNPKKG